MEMAWNAEDGPTPYLNIICMFISALLLISLIHFIDQRLCFKDLIFVENLKTLFNKIMTFNFSHPGVFIYT